QVPALFCCLASTLPASLVSAFGTNKLPTICGAGMAAAQYSRRVQINWHSILPAGLAAFVFSFLGARVVSLLKPALLKPLVLVLLGVVAIHTYCRMGFCNMAQHWFHT